MAALSPFPRPGQSNLAGDVEAMLMRVFAGEVLTQFVEKNQVMPRTRVKQVSGGALSWQFPVLGQTTTAYHEPGENLLTDTDAGGGAYLKTIAAAQRLIFADRRLTSTVFVDKLDMLLNHWDARGEYSREMGNALARAVDKNLIGVLYNATQAAATITTGGAFGGFEVIDADGDTNAASFVDSIFNAKLQLDLRSVPAEGRTLLVPPAQMKLLFSSGGAVTAAQWVDADFNGTPNGNLREGKIMRLAGFDIIETIHITQTGSYTPPSGASANKYGAGTGNTNVYNYTVGANEDIWALAFHRDAVGTVKLEDLTVESEYKIEYQGDVIVAKMVLGHGILRPECAGVIRKA